MLRQSVKQWQCAGIRIIVRTDMFAKRVQQSTHEGKKSFFKAANQFENTEKSGGESFCVVARPSQASLARMRAIFITLECAEPVFSGNGTYSRSLINSLLHHADVEVIVISASPQSPKDSINIYPAEWLSNPKFHNHVINVPKEKCWEEFGKGFENAALLESLLQFNPDIIIGVDWSALQPYQHLKKVFEKASKTIPYVYLNFRVFHASSGIPDHDRSIYKSKDAEKIITLSPADTQSLHSITQHLPSRPPISTLLPPLPRKIHSLASSYTPPYTLSSTNPPTTPPPPHKKVRLSVEKHVSVFVAVCHRLSQFLSENNIIPYMCGAAQTEAYGKEVRDKLRLAHPSSIIREDVLSHEALVEVYKKTVLNFHPALYEAYGLTIVEAAAFGVPSIVNQGGEIGATALLQPTATEERDKNEKEGIQGAHEVFVTDMNDEERVAREVQAILDPLNHSLRLAVADRARTKSLSYGEKENGELFLQHLKEVLHNK